MLEIGVMYEAKKPECTLAIAYLFFNKENAIRGWPIDNYPWPKNKQLMITPKTRFVILEHEVASRKNKRGESHLINVYKLLLTDSTIGWCMIPNFKTWKRVGVK